jgi:hypothetical protein
MRQPLHKKVKEGQLAVSIDPNMRDYSQDPFIVNKVESARAFIAKHGLPKEKLKNEKSKKS